MPKPLRILKRNEDCVLAQSALSGAYKVYDAEGDMICMTQSLETAEERFGSYDLAKVHEERRKEFARKLSEIAE